MKISLKILLKILYIFSGLIIGFLAINVLTNMNSLVPIIPLYGSLFVIVVALIFLLNSLGYLVYGFGILKSNMLSDISLGLFVLLVIIETQSQFGLGPSSILIFFIPIILLFISLIGSIKEKKFSFKN